jgi:hypothetical protein
MNQVQVVLHFKNAVLGDGLAVVAVAKTLREYADLLDAGVAGLGSQEVYQGADGSELSVVAVSSCEVRIPHLKPAAVRVAAGRTAG